MFWGVSNRFVSARKSMQKLAELVPLTHKLAKQSRVRIFRNERPRSTPLDPKLMFWGVSDHFVTTQKLMQNWMKKERLQQAFESFEMTYADLAQEHKTVTKLSGIDPLGTARKLPVRKKKSDSY
jgi:hypothetical protein